MVASRILAHLHILSLVWNNLVECPDFQSEIAETLLILIQLRSDPRAQQITWDQNMYQEKKNYLW